MTSNKNATYDFTTYNIRPVNSKDADSNNDTFSQLLSIGHDQSEIFAMGVDSRLDHVILHRLKKTEEMYAKFEQA